MTCSQRSIRLRVRHGEAALAWPAQMSVNTATPAATPSVHSVIGCGARPAAATAMPHTTSTATHCPSSSRPSWVSKSGSREGARTMARSLRVTVATPTRGEQPAEPQQRTPPPGRRPPRMNRQKPAAPSSRARPPYRVQRPATATTVSQGEVLTNLPNGATVPMFGDAHAEGVGARRRSARRGSRPSPFHGIDALGERPRQHDPQLLLVAGHGRDGATPGTGPPPVSTIRTCRQGGVDRFAEGEQDLPGRAHDRRVDRRHRSDQQGVCRRPGSQQGKPDTGDQHHGGAGADRGAAAAHALGAALAVAAAHAGLRPSRHAPVPPRPRSGPARRSPGR